MKSIPILISIALIGCTAAHQPPPRAPQLVHPVRHARVVVRPVALAPAPIPAPAPAQPPAPDAVATDRSARGEPISTRRVGPYDACVSPQPVIAETLAVAQRQGRESAVLNSLLFGVDAAHSDGELAAAASAAISIHHQTASTTALLLATREFWLLAGTSDGAARARYCSCALAGTAAVRASSDTLAPVAETFERQGRAWCQLAGGAP